MKRLKLIVIFTSIFSIGILPHNAKAQVSKTKEALQGQTFTYTYVVTYYPDREKNPLAGIYRTLMKYWIKGSKWRREEIYDEIRRITVVSDGWRYFLRSEQKTGTKTKIGRPEPPPNEHDPRKLLKEWIRKGAKKISREKINGQECEVYEKRPSKVGELKVKIWARKKDGLVVRVEEEGLTKFFGMEFIKVVHEFKDIKIGVPIDDSLFIVPKDYKLEEMP